MWLKLILILLLFYWIGKTVGNLMRAVRGSVDPPRVPPAGRYRPPTTWQGPAPANPDKHEPDIEDAKWVDL